MTAENEAFDADVDEFVDELVPGTELMLGQYKIDSFLAAGGFGITYLAKDSLDRPVVIKECFPGGFCRRQNCSVMPRSRAHQNELKSIVRLFSQEAMSLSKAGHPNIVGVHQVFEENNTAYMALDYVAGSDLLKILQDDPDSLEPEKVEGYLLKMLDAIGHVHKQGILHRDISPDNIIINQNGDPILIDFGAARANSDGTASRMLSALRVVKDGYSPQEFYIAGSEQGPSCDLYSLAASFYHIITGELPPDSQSRLTAFAENSPDPYVPLGKKTNDYSKSFCTALDKAMSVLPRDRMQSAQEWVEHINGVGAADTSVKPRKIAVKPQQQQKSSFMPMLLGSTALVAAVGAGFYFSTAGSDNAVAPAAEVETALNTPVVVEPSAPVEDQSAELDASAIDAMTGSSSAAADEDDTASLMIDGLVPGGAAEDTAPSAADVVALTDAGSIAEGFDATGEANDVLASLAPATDVAPSRAPNALENVEAPVLDIDLPSRATEAPEPRPNATGATSDEGAQTAAAGTDTTAPDGMERVIINSTWSVRLPFEYAEDDMSVVGNVMFDGWAWLKEGTRIETINGMEIGGIPAIQAMLRQTTVLEDQSQLEVLVGVGKDAEGDLIEHSLILPVVQHVALGNGTQMEVVSRRGAWETTVTKVPDASMTTLKPGDVVLEYLPSNAIVDGRMTLVDAIQADRRNGATKFPLLVMRDGVAVTAELELYPMDKPGKADAPATAAVQEPAIVVPTPEPTPAEVEIAAPVVEEPPVAEEPVAEASLTANDVSTVTEVMSPAIPFELSATEPATIAEIKPGAPFWMVPGLKILSIDGASVTSNDDVMSAIQSAADASNGTSFDLKIAVDARLSSAAIERTLKIAPETQTVLLNGLSFSTSVVNGSSKTVVVDAPEGSNFAVGDLLVAYMATGEKLDGSISLKSILERELEAGSTSFSFAVEREGQMWVEAFSLAALNQ